MHPTQNPAAQASTTPADTLRRAGRYLTRHGWIQGDYYATDLETDDIAGPFPPACAAGAIAMAICGRVDGCGVHRLPPHRSWADWRVIPTRLAISAQE